MKKNIRKFLCEIKLAEDGLVPSDVQLTRTGEFNHMWYGKFTINEQMLSQMCKNYKENIRGVDLAIDLEHGMTNLQTEAAGWIKDLYTKNKGTELWAKVKWTELGETKLSKQLYRYFSAEYDCAYEDAEDMNDEKINYGYVLLGAGLTNRPFVKSMEPTSKLSEQLMEEKLMEKKLKELETQNKALSEKVDSLKNETKNLSEVLKSKEDEIKKLNEAKVLSERTVKFNEMLANAKVCEAQRESWMKQDLVKFAELASSAKINLNEKGSGSTEEIIEKTNDMEKKFDDAIDKVVAEKKLSYSEAMKIVLNENKEIREWFNKR